MTATVAAARRPDATEFAPFYAGYVAGVPEGDIISILHRDGDEWQRVLAELPEARGDHRYAEGKWSIKQVVGHVSDAERIFTYRALRVARGDRTPLASFDENAYAETAGSDRRTLSALAAELKAVREATLALFNSLPEDAWTRTGTASEKSVSVRALAYITAGHAQHHLKILRERYLRL
jgi:uncharacterized damage-inducible protein DinB